MVVLSVAPLHAEPAARPAGGAFMNFVPIVAIIGIFYFLLIRPQQRQAKEHKRMLDALKRGDRVLTQGGIYGTVQAVKGTVVELKISDTTKIEVAKSYIAQVVTGQAAAEAEPAVNGAARS